MQRIIGEDGLPSMVSVNQPQQSPTNPAITEVKNDLTIGRYDVVMDTGPGYETKRLEGADSMLELLKTPLAEPIAKVGADLVVRNMDFAGASDLADRLMPMTGPGMDKAVEGLPPEAKGIVLSMQHQMQQQTQMIQHLQLELKYKTQIESGWMDVEREKTQAKTKDTLMSNQTRAHDTDTKGTVAIHVAEITQAGKLLDTHVQGRYDKDARADELAAAKAAENSNPN